MRAQRVLQIERSIRLLLSGAATAAADVPRVAGLREEGAWKPRSYLRPSPTKQGKEVKLPGGPVTKRESP